MRSLLRVEENVAEARQAVLQGDQAARGVNVRVAGEVERQLEGGDLMHGDEIVDGQAHEGTACQGKELFRVRASLQDRLVVVLQDRLVVGLQEMVSNLLFHVCR